MPPNLTFISDISRLSEFPGDRAEYARRTMLLYGIDVDRLHDDRFTTIFDAIARR
jgi:hypothetical protein